MTEEGRARVERRKAAGHADANDTPAALELCRRIRDDETAATADRLKAIELLAAIKSK